MSRDALLVVLAIAVVVNFAFLAQVAVLQRRRREAAEAAIGRWNAGSSAAASSKVPAGRRSPVPPAATEPPAVPSTRPDRERSGAEAPGGGAHADAPPGAEATGVAVAATGAIAGASEGVADPARAEATGGAVDVTAPATRAAGPETTPGARTTDTGEPMARPTSRTRRFAMPRVEEDRGRTEAAIGAFLGEPSLAAGTAQAHRPRRRSRRQRAPGETPPSPTVVVAALAGWDELRHLTGREGAGRFSEALGNAVRGTIRSGDELMELGDGRLRIVVHADEEGARALIMRAATICDPWLRAAPVPLSLRARTVGAGPVEAGRTASAGSPLPASAARGGPQPTDSAAVHPASGTNGTWNAPPVPDPASRHRAATAGRTVPPADPA